MAEEEVVDYDDDVNDEVVKNTLGDNNDTGYVQVKLLLAEMCLCGFIMCNFV